MNKHVHKFYPTGEKRSPKMNNEIRTATGSNQYSCRYIKDYNDIEYKFICECGKVKWVKEK